MINNVIAWVLATISSAGYAGLFGLSFLENLALPIPSEVIVPFSAFLAITGRFNIYLVIIVATLGNWVGSMTLFTIARSGGRWFLERYGKYLLISREDLDNGDRWFSKHGPATVFWFRLLPVGRAVVSVPAGISKMSVKKFALYTLIGSIIWNIGLAYLGYKAGQNWETLHPYFQKFDYLVVLFIVAVIVWWIIRHIRKK